MKEIDLEICGDCKFFKYIGTDKWGYFPNETGEGKCSSQALAEMSVVINDKMTPRKALEVNGLNEEIRRMDRENSSCFKTRFLEFSEEALEAFELTDEERRKLFSE